MVKRINELIKDIDRNGLLSGIGKPEPLRMLFLSEKKHLPPKE
ncbi:type II toxin-antitoxin system YoeB family toxin [Blautia sp.]|nr:type II toxin-antitoxin system YoeB family toxin [Blautia sp.]MEE0811729.1 type II toxin-antitoxin system YoeB family toxin [Blautia sp.]